MLRNIFHTICSLWLALLLLFGGTPMDAIHSFAHHNDTVDTVRKEKGFEVSAPHHHCAFLSFHLMPFAAPTAMSFPVRMQAKIYGIYTEAVAESCAGFFVPQAGLRGPPADC